MGFFSSLGSALSSIASSACNVISSVASKITDAVSTTATKIAEMGVELAAKVGDTIKAIGISLGIINPNSDMAELGEKAMMADMKPDDFDTINDYINYLQDDVTIDREKFDNLDEKDLLARSSIGASITLKGINEKLDTVVTPDFLAAVAQQGVESKEIIETIKVYKEKQLETGDYGLYIKDELSVSESGKHADALVAAYQRVDPDLSVEQIEDKVMRLKS
ncbi:hypothetical protein [Salinivibrio sp. MA440]|uniref:hypothetical protein n=1 Tax=Salinivibrio sp. MA440 TaxID=1909456 RepID=UPI001F5222B1|nr:hypothetical protein [Salinivibrio sp. MA440]